MTGFYWRMWRVESLGALMWNSTPLQLRRPTGAETWKDFIVLGVFYLPTFLLSSWSLIEAVTLECRETKLKERIIINGDDHFYWSRKAFPHSCYIWALLWYCILTALFCLNRWMLSLQVLTPYVCDVGELWLKPLFSRSVIRYQTFLFIIPERELLMKLHTVRSLLLKTLFLSLIIPHFIMCPRKMRQRMHQSTCVHFSNCPSSSNAVLTQMRNTDAKLQISVQQWCQVKININKFIFLYLTWWSLIFIWPEEWYRLTLRLD